jgi:hypothetical protein
MTTLSDDQVKHERDIEVATLLGRIDATLTSIDARMSKVETDLKSVVGTVNRWKGATAILILVGGLVGWLGNLFVKGNHT